MIHVFQVHKESIDTVPAAKSGRESFDLEIFGMVGVPQDLIQEKQIKIYGEPQAKKQKLAHNMVNLRPLGGQPLFNQNGMRMPVIGMQQPPMQMRQMGGGYNQMQMPQRMMQMPHQQNMMHQRGNNMMNFNQPMPPPMQRHGGMPQSPMGGMPNRPPPPRGHPGMGHPQQPPHMGMNPNMQHPGGMVPPPQQQFQPGMVMNPPPIQHQQQQPLSEAAKVEVVARQDNLVSQASVQKKAKKKKIVRIFDQPGVCMEEIRANNAKYLTQNTNLVSAI